MPPTTTQSGTTAPFLTNCTATTWQIFKKLSAGQCIQLSKYMNDLLSMLKQQQTKDNTIDGRCFKCNQLWKGTNQVLGALPLEEMHQPQKE
jgi:hypothetical protein